MIGLVSAALLLLVLLAAIVAGLVARLRSRPVLVTWSCEVGGEEWSWKAERIGKTWTVTSHDGEGGIFASYAQAQDWTIGDIRRRLTA